MEVDGGEILGAAKVANELVGLRSVLFVPIQGVQDYPAVPTVGFEGSHILLA